MVILQVNQTKGTEKNLLDVVNPTLVGLVAGRTRILVRCGGNSVREPFPALCERWVVRLACFGVGRYQTLLKICSGLTGHPNFGGFQNSQVCKPPVIHRISFSFCFWSAVKLIGNLMLTPTTKSPRSCGFLLLGMPRPGKRSV